MKKKTVILVALISVGIFLVALTSSSNEKKSDSQVLSDWIQVHLKLVRTTKGVAHVAYSRHFSYTAVAVYEASIAQNNQYQSLGNQLQGLEKLPVLETNSDYDVEASVNAAYASMLRYFYGRNSNARLIDSMETAQQMRLTRQDVKDKTIKASTAFANQISKAIIVWAEGDGSDKANVDYVVPRGEGLWQPTPPTFGKPAVPYWKNNRAMSNLELNQLIKNLPPAYSVDKESGYYKMVKEVVDVSQALTPEQRNIALFWDDSPNGKLLSVPGHWSSILAQVLSTNKIALAKGAEAYVKMHLSLHDACIVAWYGKYQYNVIRPVTNIANMFQKNWEPVIETPPHPEFPAAHATLSNAAATGLTSALGDKISFTDYTYSDLGMKPRKFSSFMDAAQEAGISRLYGGIHYRYSIEEGGRIGQSTANNLLQKIHMMR